MTCKIFYSTASNHCVTKLCEQHCAFLQNRTTNFRRVAQFRDYHRVSGKIVEPVILWLQILARDVALVAKTAHVYLVSWLNVLLHQIA